MRSALLISVLALATAATGAQRKHWTETSSELIWRGRYAWRNFPERPLGYVLGMVWTDAQIGEEQLLASRMLASTVRLDGHKDSINIFQCLWVACL